MTCICPHCQAVNRVAGYYRGPGVTAAQHQAEPAQLVWCGFCGERFEPVAQQEVADEPIVVVVTQAR